MGRTTPLPRPRRPDPSPRSAHRPHRHRRGGHPNLDSLDRLATPPEEITSYTTNPDLTRPDWSAPDRVKCRGTFPRPSERPGQLSAAVHVIDIETTEMFLPEPPPRRSDGLNRLASAAA